MGVGRVIKGIFRPMVNVKDWMHYDAVTSSGKQVFRMAKSLVIPTKASRRESFEEAMQRLNLTEEDLREKINALRRLVTIFSVLSLLVALYLVYLIAQGEILSSLMCTSVLALSLVLTFRYNFWLFQIQQRRLGCTFNEWLHSLRGKDFS